MLSEARPFAKQTQQQTDRKHFVTSYQGWLILHLGYYGEGSVENLEPENAAASIQYLEPQGKLWPMAFIKPWIYYQFFPP